MAHRLSLACWHRAAGEGYLSATVTSQRTRDIRQAKATARHMLPGQSHYATLRSGLRERLDFTCSGCTLYLRRDSSVGIPGRAKQASKSLRRQPRHHAF